MRGLLIAEFDSRSSWQLHPSVALREESFGALLYHYGTRRLSFLKERRLLELVRTLEVQPVPERACELVGIEPAQRPVYLKALARLARTSMLVPAAASTNRPGEEAG